MPHGVAESGIESTVVLLLDACEACGVVVADDGDEPKLLRLLHHRELGSSRHGSARWRVASVKE